MPVAKKPNPQRPTLDSLGVQIKDHWKEHRPRMYREPEKAGQLDKAVYLAQERTRDAFAELVSNQGVPAFQADEATRELWAFLPDEEESDEAPDEGTSTGSPSDGRHAAAALARGNRLPVAGGPGAAADGRPYD